MTTTVANPVVDVDEERLRVALALGGGPTMQAWLASIAGGSGSRWHVIDAKYQPRSSCLVLYRCGLQEVAVVVRLDGLVDLAADEGVDGSAVVAGMRAFVFPDDPVLGGLSRLLDPAVMAPMMAEVLGRPVASLTCTVLRYRPAKRTTLGLSVRVRGRPGERIPLIAKVYSSAVKAAAVYDECRQLTEAIVPTAPLVLADAVAFVPGVPLVVQSHLEGTSLDQLLAVSAAFSMVDRPALQAITAAARGLAVVHGSPPVSSRVRSSTTELVRFARRAGSIAEVDPQTGSHLVALAELLAAAFARLPEAESTLVHGDCKPSQFRLATDVRGLTRPEAVGLIDFDHCGLADSAADVGAFLASLRKIEVMAALRRHGPAMSTTRFRALEANFAEAYCASRPLDAADERDFTVRVGWHQAAALLRKALRVYARAPRSPLTLGLAGHSRSCLEALPAG